MSGRDAAAAKVPPASARRLVAVSVATIATVLLLIFVVQDLARQPVLVTSLASSAFLLYYQPQNEVNRFKPLVFGHALAAGVGFVASLLLPLPYVATAVGIATTVVLMSLLRIVYPPAISTTLVFAYRPHDVTVIVTFLGTLAVVLVLALVYFALWYGIAPRRWGAHFGFLKDET